MTTKEDIARYRANRQDELDGAALYRTLAEVEGQPHLAEVYRRLAIVEERHAQFWEQKLRAVGQPVLPWRQGWRRQGSNQRTSPFAVLPLMRSSFTLPVPQR